MNNKELVELVGNNLVVIKHIKEILTTKPKPDLNFRDIHGRTILFYAANEEIAELLIEHGANFYIKDTSGKNATDYNEYVKFVARNRCINRQKSLGIIRNH